MKVAVAQIGCVAGDVAANLLTHLTVVAQARAQDVELVVFPELSLTDYISAPDCPALAMTRDTAMLARIAEAAGPMAVSLGFIERDAQGRVFNAQALIADGAVAIHRKINLPGYGALREDRVYAKGEALELTPLGGVWRAATLICADSWNPALPWLAALAGADLLILPVASARGAVDAGFDNPRGWDINLAHTAMTYGLPTLFANHCGSRGPFDFWGGSRILDASGRVLAQAGEAPSLIVATLDPADGARARNALPTMRDSDPALIHRLLGSHPSRAKA